MALSLVSLQFHRNGDAATLPLRLHDGATPLTLPEWHSGDTDPAESPVAFLQAPTAAARKVLAKFKRNNPSITNFDVRALAPPGNPNLAGEVSITPVAFTTGNTVTVDLPLSGASLGQVAVHTDSLKWQWRPPLGAWTDLVTTSHRIYVVLDEPGAPWDSSKKSRWVWTDVLEFACLWAAGAKTSDEARSAIAAAFFNLGKGPNQLFRYGHGGQYVSGNVFDCAHMLQTLRGAPDLGNLVECTDVASVVSTFANALGGVVWQARMGLEFHTTPVEVIGAGAFASQTFGFHEVAWGNTASAPDPVWDGCLQVQAGPGVGKSALDLPFAGYQPELLQSGTCDPQSAGNPSNRRLGVITIAPHAAAEHVKKAQNHVEAIHLNGPAGQRLFIWGFFPTDDLVSGWSIRARNSVEGVGPKLPAYDTYWRPAADKNGPLMRIQIALLPSQEDAGNYLLEILQGVASPVLSTSLGDHGFVTEDGQFAIFALGNSVLQFTSAGLQAISVIEYATRTDALLLQTGVPGQPGNQFAIPHQSQWEPVPFSLPDSAPSGQPLWYRMLSSTGELAAPDGVLRYKADRPGDQLITVCTHSSGQKFSVQTQAFLSQ